MGRGGRCIARPAKGRERRRTLREKGLRVQCKNGPISGERAFLPWMNATIPKEERTHPIGSWTQPRGGTHPSPRIADPTPRRNAFIPKEERTHPLGSRTQPQGGVHPSPRVADPTPRRNAPNPLAREPIAQEECTHPLRSRTHTQGGVHLSPRIADSTPRGNAPIPRELLILRRSVPRETPNGTGHPALKFIFPEFGPPRPIPH